MLSVLATLSGTIAVKHYFSIAAGEGPHPISALLLGMGSGWLGEWSCSSDFLKWCPVLPPPQTGIHALKVDDFRDGEMSHAAALVLSGTT